MLVTYRTHLTLNFIAAICGYKLNDFWNVNFSAIESTTLAAGLQTTVLLRSVASFKEVYIHFDSKAAILA